MSAAKLLKKHELSMALHIKKGLTGSYIYILTSIFIVSFLNPLFSSPDILQKDKKWVIVIDPGHGGRDPGALGSFSKEKNITLAIALKAGAYIQQNIKNVSVIYTRKDDSTVSLQDRPKIANQNNADLFISIHANWASAKSIYGAETFIMGLSNDKANLEVAMKENEVMLLEEDYSTKYAGFDPKSPESYIMFTLMQNTFQKQSTALASKIQTQLRDGISRRDRGVKQAGFWVLYTTTMPSVLVETGFITSQSEEKYLNSKEGQDKLANAIFMACRDYISEISSRTGISAIQASLPAKDDVVFMVQIANSASKTELKPENFKGIKDVSEIIHQERYRYAAGRFSEYSEAVIYRNKLEADFPDAFVIAVKDNKIVPLQDAIEQKGKNKLQTNEKGFK
jgi:N-acetylmuramoyl-L-alanine amidase